MEIPQVTDWEKSAQSACHDPLRMSGYYWRWYTDVKIYWVVVTTTKSGRMEHSRWTASPTLQKVKSRADEVLHHRQRCVFAPVFRRIKSNSAHTMETILSLLSLQTAPHRIFLALKSPR
jgi:hypothetical protein